MRHFTIAGLTPEESKDGTRTAIAILAVPCHYSALKGGRGYVAALESPRWRLVVQGSADGPREERADGMKVLSIC